MIERNQPKIQRKRPAQVISSRRWPTFIVMISCGLVLLSGFFLAGRQHFSSMDYGMKNSRLRKQVSELEAEKRRLLLTREVALSPSEIKKSVKRAGMLESTASEVQLAQFTSATKDKAVPQLASLMKPMIAKTVSVAPVNSPAAPVKLRSDRPVKIAKMTVAAE